MPTEDTATSRWRPRVRIRLLNLMLAMVVIAVTLAFVGSGRSIWPTYIAATWLYVSVPDHDPVTHDALTRDLISPAVVRATLDNPAVAGLRLLRGASDPRGKLLESVRIDVHPQRHSYVHPDMEVIRIAVEAPSAFEAHVLKNVFVRAYVDQWPGKVRRVNPARPERVAHPLFGRPWGLVATVAISLSLCVASLLVPLRRGRGRAWRMAEAATLVGLVIGLAVWWLLAHPEPIWRVGGYRLF